MQVRILTITVTLCAMVLAVRAEKITVTGRVTDEAGQPIGGVQFSSYWLKEKLRWNPTHSFTADASGHFQVEVDYQGKPRAWLAMDPEQARGAVFVLRTNRQDHPLRLRLTPLMTVRGQFTCTELGRAPRWSSAYLSLLPDKLRLVQDHSDPPRFELKVPMGRYLLRGYGSGEVDSMSRELTLTSTQAVHDLGLVEMSATPIGRHHGKAPPPWHVTAAQSVPRSVQAADYLGRWLLIEFWGYW